ncbi:MAG: hypothetical protein PHH54_04230 [Candidatus Nanoarchaeia archaeon]|nr:hypothetical protein [Candidatus Nanoarchaeia archaeon]MDD5741168.1 hypothetical protein [Candidatus Nanoarchaeia archaeon]
MRDIIQRLLATDNSKERTKLLEKFREFQFGKSRRETENILFEIFKDAKQMLENTKDNEEKRVALRTLNAIFLIYPSETMAELLQVKAKETPVKDRDVMEIIDICLELLEDNDGNLRLSAAYLIDHLRGYMPDYNYVDLFYNLLSLKNSPKNKGKNKKTIEFCLSKIFSPFLEAILDASYPLEVKKMKIRVHSKNEKVINTAIDVEHLANQMVSETEKYIQKILAIRGEYLLEGNFIPYIENIGIFQIFYEMQRLRELYLKGEINKELMKNYLNSRISIFANNRIDMLDGLSEREEFSLVLMDFNKNLVVKDLQETYDFLIKINSVIENLS